MDWAWAALIASAMRVASATVRPVGSPTEGVVDRDRLRASAAGVIDAFTPRLYGSPLSRSSLARDLPRRRRACHLSGHLSGRTALMRLRRSWAEMDQ